MSSELLETLGFRRSGRVDRKDAEGGISDSLSTATGSVLKTGNLSDLPESIREVRGPPKGGEGPLDQTSYRACDESGFTRILQQTLCCSQKERQMAPDNRSVAPQSFSKMRSFQDGNCGFCLESSGQRTMDDFDRSERCVLSNPDSSQFEEIPALRIRRRGVSVSGTLFRSIYGSPRIHDHDASCDSESTPVRSSYTPLSRRLVDCDQQSIRIGEQYEGSSGPSDKTWAQSESEEVRSHTNYQNHVPRYSDRFRIVPGVPLPGEDRQISKAGEEILSKRSSSCPGMAQNSGPFSFSRETRSRRETTYSPTTIPTQGIMVPSSKSDTTDLSVRYMPFSSEVVDESLATHGGSPSGTSQCRSHDLHRRLQGRLGSMSGPVASVRPVVSSGSSTPHQCVGVRGSSPGTLRVLSVSDGLDGRCDERQCNGRFLPQQRGGDTFEDSVLQNYKTSGLGGQSRHHPQVHFHPRPIECQSRRSQQEEPDFEDRMVIMPRCLPSDLPRSGTSVCRSLCDKYERQTSSVLLPGPRSSGGRGGCLSAGLDGSDGLRLSTYGRHQADPQQASCRGSRASPGGSILAEPRMVSRPSGSAGGLAAKSSSEQEVVKTTALPQVSSKPRNVAPARLEIVSRHLQEAGFSERASDTIARHHRASTSSIYDSKWRLFCDWCDRGEIDPITASVPIVADFLLYLFHEKSLKVSTIKGYRSAIADVLKLKGTDLTNSQELGMLVQSLEIQRPVVPSVVPKWDLALVLRRLTVKPYEPIHSATTRLLAAKTAFLLGLASAKRVGELHAMTADINHINNWQEVSIQIDPSFIAKTQKPSDSSSALGNVRIPALAPSVEPGLPDRLLCPVRALRYYLKRTEALRSGTKKLFLSTCPGVAKEASKDTISRWIKLLIKEAHSSITEDDAKLVNCRTHELRALAASLLFCATHSLQSVMEAACWRSHSTFSSFYLRDISLTRGDLTSLGPIVAGQRIVGLPNNPF